MKIVSEHDGSTVATKKDNWDYFLFDQEVPGSEKVSNAIQEEGIDTKFKEIAEEDKRPTTAQNVSLGYEIAQSFRGEWGNSEKQTKIEYDYEKKIVRFETSVYDVAFKLYQRLQSTGGVVFSGRHSKVLIVEVPSEYVKNPMELFA